MSCSIRARGARVAVPYARNRDPGISDPARLAHWLPTMPVPPWRIALLPVARLKQLRRWHWLLLGALVTVVGIASWYLWRHERESRRQEWIAEARRRLDRAVELDDIK